MAATEFGRNDVQTAKRWARKVEMQIVPQTILGTLGGRSEDNAFKIVDDLEKGAGDRVRNYFLRLLTDEEGLPLPPAATGDTSPEGQEKAQKYPTYDVDIDMTSQAVKFKKYMTGQRLPFELRDKAKKGLAKWWIDFLDICFLAHACGYTVYNTTRPDFAFHNAIVGPDADHRLFANPATNTTDEDVGADNTAIMTKEVIDQMILRAEEQHEMGNFAIGMANCLGNNHWVLILSTRQHHDLKQDPEWQRQFEEAPVDRKSVV